MKLLNLALLILSLWMSPVQAQASLNPTDPLFEAEPFTFEVIPLNQNQRPTKLQLSWDIAPKHFLYQEAIDVSVITESDPVNAQTLKLTLPKGIIKVDPESGEKDVLYKEQLRLQIQIPEDTLKVQVRYQGCSEQGICFPPMLKTWEQRPSTQGPKLPFSIGPWLKQVAIFFGFGLLLSLTPCILPMVPILAEILLGQGKRPFGKAILLASAYLLTMAFCYAQFGYWAAKLGLRLNIGQQPSILLGLIVLLLILAAVQLDWLKINFSLTHHIKRPVQRFYKRHFPNFRIPHFKTSPGTLLGAMALGGVSAIMISPCVTPALVGSLVYIADSPYPLLASATLFAMGLGMGLPLAVVACFGSQFLPRTGPWMIRVKKITGILLLILAAVLSTRLGWFHFHQRNLPEINNLRAWHQTLSQSDSKEIILLDVSADWCQNCQVMAKTIFDNPSIRDRFKQSGITVYQFDITKETAEKTALLKSLNIVGPPTILFFKNGRELPNTRLIGYLSEDEFLKHLDQIRSDPSP